MKKTITIVTSNKGKIHSLTHALEGLDVQVESVNLDLLEPQYNTIEEVAKYKAAEAFRLLKKPLIVHDGGLVVPALKGFPGVYTKYISSTLTPQDFVNLMKDKQDKTCYLTQSMIYVDEKGELHQFQDKLMGKIADKVSTVDNDKGWGMLWQVFVPKGADKPLAEIPEDVFYNQIRPLAKTNSVWEDLKSFLIKVYNIPTPEVKKTVEVALKKVEKPIVPVTKEADDSKKKEVPTNKGQGLDVKPVETPETKEKSSQINENRVQSSENVVQTSENNTFEKWFDNLGELMESGKLTQIKKTLSCVFYENEQFVFDNENEKFYFSKADINKQNKFGHTLAMFFAQYVSSSSALQLISNRNRSTLSLTKNVDLLKDADWQKKDKKGRTVLHYYCQNHDVQYDNLEKISQNVRLDFYERDAYGMSPLLYLFSEEGKMEYIYWMLMESEFLQNNFSKALDQEGNNFLITLLEKNNWEPHKKAQSKEDDDYEYDEGENDDEYEMEQIRDLTEGIVYYIRDLSGVKSKDGLSLLQYIKKHNLKEFCEYLAGNASDEKTAEQAKVLFLNSEEEKTTAKKAVKPAVAQKATSKKEVKKTPQKEAEKATDKKMSAQKATSKTTANKPSAAKKIASQAPKKRVAGKGRSNGE